MLKWLKNWRGREAEDEDLEAEFRSHLDIEAHQRMAMGESPEDAYREARRTFGNPVRLHEETRETWGWASSERFFDDVRFGLRMLRKSPMWTFVAGVTLASCIGLTTGTFSLVYSVLLQPLPYTDPDRLMAIWTTSLQSQSFSGSLNRFNVSPANWRDWKEQTRAFEGIAITRPVANFNLTGDGPPERLQGARVSANLTEVLRVPPLLGRGISEAEAKNDAPVVLLSYAFWKRRFGADPGILGRKIQLNGTPFEVIGVMPQRFQYPGRGFEVWTPLFIPPQMYRDRVEYSFLAVGRLRTGVTRRQAQADMSNIMARLAIRYPLSNKEQGALVESLLESMGAGFGKALYLLLSASFGLLLIGGMNLSVLMIGRANARSREMSLRAALGAGGGRLSRQILAEVLPFCAAGAAGGVLLAFLFLRALRPWLPLDLPRAESIGLNGPVLLFSISVSVTVVLLAAILPARLASRQDPARALQSESRAVSGTGRIRDLLVIAQIGMAMLLIFGASLLGRSLMAVMRVNPGFSIEGILTMHLAVTRAQYPSDSQVASYYRRLTEEIQTIPGVVAAGFVNRLPLTGVAQINPIVFETNPDAPSLSVDTRSITPDYFSAIGIPLLRGRTFSGSDSETAPRAVIIDEVLARKTFGGEGAVGKRLRIQFGTIRGPWMDIVGVVGHIRNDSPEVQGRSQIYYPESQNTQDRAALVVRTIGDPGSYTSTVVARIHQVNPHQPVYDVRTMHEWLGRSLQSRDLLTGLTTLFGIASLALSCLGLYGVVSYTVGLRRREFGIRVALGAPAREIHGIVLTHAGKLAICGCLAGLVCIWPISRVLRTLLFDVQITDLYTLIGVPLLLIGVALLAGLGPALKASRVDPAEALRLD